MRLKTLALGLILGCGIASNAAAVSPLQTAFNTLGQGDFNSPQSFNTQVRTGIFLGSGRVRFGSPTRPRFTNLISLTAPKFEAGCNGIDFHLGGFSYVNGEQILTMLEAAIPAAAMYAVELAVGGLCGDCLNTLRSVLDTVSAATKMSMDSCLLGRQLAQSVGLPDRQSFCSGGATGSGTTDDQISAKATVCKAGRAIDDTLKNIKSGLEDVINSPSSSNEEKKEAAATLEKDLDKYANKTWLKLIAAGFVPYKIECDSDKNGAERPCTFTPLDDASNRQRFIVAELFMSVIGTEGPKNSQTSTLQPGDFAAILMCGLNGFGEPPRDPSGGEQQTVKLTTVQEARAQAVIEARSICSSAYRGLADEYSRTPGSSEPGSESGPTIIHCLPTPNEDESTRYQHCANTISLPLREWWTQMQVDTFIGDGLLLMTLERIYSIIAKIDSNTAFSTDDIAFMGAMPFPMYRAVNLAVTFPELRHQLLGSRTRLIANILAVEYIQALISEAGRRSIPMQVAPEILSRLNNAVTYINQDLDVSITKVDAALLRSERFMQSIVSIEQAMRKAVLDRGIASNYAATKEFVNSAWLNNNAPMPSP